MAFLPADYRNIPSSGVLPAALVPADQISFGYTFTYEKDVDPLSGLQSTLSGRVVLELKDQLGNLKATFDLRETYRITLLPLGPGLVAYAWNWDSNKEQFTATDASGAPIETEGQFSLGVIPAGDGGSSDRSAYITSTFYSFIFNVDVIEGDVLKIKFHNLSAGTVVARASLKVATRPGAGKLPALVDEQRGQQLRVATSTKGTRLLRSRRLNSPLKPEQTEWTQEEEGTIVNKPLSNPQMVQAEGNTLYVLGMSGNQLLLYLSQDDGKTWKAIMSETTNIKLLAAHLASGGRYIVYGVDAAQKPAYTILKHGQDTWTVSETGLCTLTQPPQPETPPTTPTLPTSSPTPTTPTTPSIPTNPAPTPTPITLPTTRVSALEEGEGGILRLLANDKDGTLLIFLSRDGKTWEQAPATKPSEDEDSTIQPSSGTP